MIKKDRGITLISLSIAVIVILTITGMILYSAKDSIYIKNLTNMQNDIANLRDKISLYYSEYGDIPVQTEYPDVTNLETAGVIGANDTGKFYIIELEKLKGLTLNYGEDYEIYKENGYTYSSDLRDIYIINEDSHNIFFVEGISVKENNETKMYYTDYTEGDTEVVILKELQDWHEETSEDGETIITNGVARFKVGDYVNYDPTNGGTITTTYTSPTGTYHDENYSAANDDNANMKQGNGHENQTFSVTADANGWRVLGVDEKTNEILLISANTLRETDGSYFALKGPTGYEWGIEELNSICEIFGKGKGASGARSITVEDVNKMTGYNPDTAQYAYGINTITYGDEVTYTRNADIISYKDTLNNKAGTQIYGGFKYWNIRNKMWKNLENGESVTLRSTAYEYYPETLTENQEDNKMGVSTDSLEYELLFSNTLYGEEHYWLASSWITTCTGDYGVPNYGYYTVNKGKVNTTYETDTGDISIEYIFESSGYPHKVEHGIRPIISLKSDISILQQEGTSDNPHQIQ